MLFDKTHFSLFEHDLITMQADGRASGFYIIQSISSKINIPENFGLAYTGKSQFDIAQVNVFIACYGFPDKHLTASFLFNEDIIKTGLVSTNRFIKKENSHTITIIHGLSYIWFTHDELKTNGKVALVNPVKSLRSE
jgi:hypothetical protein